MLINESPHYGIGLSVIKIKPTLNYPWSKRTHFVYSDQGKRQKRSQVSRLPQHSIQMSAFTFPAVCLWSDVSLVFPIWKTCLLSFGPQCSCQCKSGRTLGPIDADVRKDSLCSPQGLINDRSLLLQGVSRRVEGAAMNCKCETTDLPAMQTPWCIIAHLGIRAYCTKQGLPVRWVLKMPIQ